MGKEREERKGYGARKKECSKLKNELEIRKEQENCREIEVDTTEENVIERGRGVKGERKRDWRNVKEE